MVLFVKAEWLERAAMHHKHGLEAVIPDRTRVQERVSRNVEGIGGAPRQYARLIFDD